MDVPCACDLYALVSNDLYLTDRRSEDCSVGVGRKRPWLKACAVDAVGYDGGCARKLLRQDALHRL